MKNKKIFSISFIVLISLLFIGCSNTKGILKKEESSLVDDDAIHLQIAHVEPESRSTHRALLHFKESIEKNSDGKIAVDIYPNGSLGGDVQLTESTALGTLDIALPSTSVLTTYSEEFGLLDMPYLFNSSESAFNALDGDVGEYFNKILEKQGLVCLGYSYNGPRSTTSNVKPISKPEDLKGLKMRVMESPIFIDYYKTLGANPTPMSFTELYTGLQQGAVDAQENPPSLTFANKFFEVQKYSSIDEHVHNFLGVIINKDKFDQFSEANKELIRKEIDKFIKEQRKLELEDNAKAIEDLEVIGNLKTNFLNKEQKEKFREALEPMYQKYSKIFGPELFDMCEKYNN